jgi:hypothetical protein
MRRCSAACLRVSGFAASTNPTLICVQGLFDILRARRAPLGFSHPIQVKEHKGEIVKADPGRRIEPGRFTEFNFGFFQAAKMDILDTQFSVGLHELRIAADRFFKLGSGWPWLPLADKSHGPIK